jgi:NADH-quinone oxidoreductase subunit E
MMLLSEQAYQKIDQELTKFPSDQKQSAIMAALAIAQDEHGWLSTATIADVARYLDVPPIAVQEVATFYSMFNTAPVGKYKLTLCTNLPCALRGSDRVGDHLKRRLQVDYQGTTTDGMFTLVEGECMGACGDAPVVLMNNKHMCVHMSEERLDVLIDRLREQGEMQPGETA